jgi:hypothetical protein
VGEKIAHADDDSTGDFSRMVVIARKITLKPKEFALLYEYLDREHSITWDPKVIGKTTKIGKKLWDRVQEIAVEYDFVPTHEPIEGGQFVYTGDSVPEEGELVWLGDPHDAD